MFKSGIAKKLLFALGLPVLAGAQTFKYWDVLDTSKTPKTLSATGLYTNITAAKKTMLANAYKFEVNSPLWSDGSFKTRWVMTKPGTSITYDEKNDYWGYPDSAIFIKLFAVDTVPGDTTSRLLFETRFLINKKELVDPATGKKMDSWYSYTYKWRRNQQDADLVSQEGADDSIKIFPTGRTKPGIMKKWRFPSKGQCEQCHRVGFADTVHGRSVLGFFTAQLNRPRADLANINQLEYFFQQNLLKGVKPAAWSTAPRWYGVTDSMVEGKRITVDTRARAYIAANCSGCHGYRGMATSATFGVDLNYDYHDMVEQGRLEYRHKSTSWPFNLDDDSIQPKYYPKSDTGNNPKGYDSLTIEPALVVPGYPQKSVILYRQMVRRTEPGNYDSERNQMPPLATYEVNEAANDLIRRWILTMPKIPSEAALGIRGAGHNVRTQLKGPAIQGRQIVLPQEMAGPATMKVFLTTIQGRSIELTRMTRTVYALPSNLTPGIYIIKVGKQNFTRHLF